MISSIRQRSCSRYSQLLFLFIVNQMHQGSQAAAKPWDGAEGLEWYRGFRPPPYHTFSTHLSEIGSTGPHER